MMDDEKQDEERVGLSTGTGGDVESVERDGEKVPTEGELDETTTETHDPSEEQS